MLVPITLTPVQFRDLAGGWNVLAAAPDRPLCLSIDAAPRLGWRGTAHSSTNVTLPSDTAEVLRRGERVRYTPPTVTGLQEDTYEVSLSVGLADCFGGYAPGRYYCGCRACGTRFEGDKRAYACFACALKAAAEFIEPPAAAPAPVHQPGVLVNLTAAAVARLLLLSGQHRDALQQARDAAARGNGAAALRELADVFQHACGHALTPVAAGAVLRELVDLG